MSSSSLLCLVIVAVVASGHVIDFDPDHDLLKILTHHVDPVEESTEEDVSGCPHCHKWAGPCDKSKCKLPRCRCSGDDIPGNLNNSQTPQMVIITAQNAIHDHNVNLYIDLFHGRVNPGRCPAVGSFYVSSDWTSPYDVQLLAHYGHEIGMNGAKDLGVPWWTNASVADWCKQIGDNRIMLSHFSNLKPCQIQGFRAPNLYMGGNTQFMAYQKCGVRYDATRVALNYPKHPNFMWPYSYDNTSTQDCPIGICANMSLPGIWQMPLEALPDSKGVPCAALGGCRADNEDEMYNILKDGFDIRYNNNRAPLMVSLDEAFLRQDYKFNALSRFMDYVATKASAYFVTAAQALDWMRNPHTIDCHCNPFPCNGTTVKMCPYPRSCYYDRDNKFVPRGAPGVVRVMDICASSCPACYPRFGDPYGTSC